MRLLLFIFILFSFQSWSQLETQNWYFGSNAGITFATIPPTALLNGAISTFEGSSTFSDSQGNLMFYTDGMFVYNKLHQQMPNGFGLLGNPSSAQSGVIVPKPGSADLFYIFTVDAEGGPNGFRYSIVDMTLQNGLGDVVQGSKNTLLFAPSVEKVAAVAHANGLYYWVIAHGLNNNTYYAYLVDCSGINTPVISNTGQIEGTPGWGCLAASSDGTKLATAMCSKGFELLDFNNQTGIVSNPILLLNPGGAYGISFSPNNQVLYACKIEGGQIYQWDISSGNPATIISSLQQIGTGEGSPGGYRGGAIQLGLDNKLYIPHCNQPYLSCIHNPNNLGTACNLQHFAINLQGQNAQLGLPPFVQSFFIPETVIAPTILCDSVLFSYSPNSATYDSLQWNFGDFSSGLANQSNLSNPSHTFPGPGNYTISLVKYLECVSDTTYYQLDLDSINSYTLLEIQTCDSIYSWNGSIISQSGTYQDTLLNATGCDSIIVLNLSLDYLSPTQISLTTCGAFTWNGQTYDTSGTFVFQTFSSNGCDSTVILDLEVNPIYQELWSIDICQGEEIIINNTSYSNAGNYTITLQSINNCDSVINLDIAVIPRPPAPIIDFTIPLCQNDSIQLSSSANLGELNWTGPNDFNSNQYQISLPATINNAGQYQAWQVANSCSSDTVTFTIDLNQTIFIDDLQIPNILTLNHDGVNDEIDLNSTLQNCFEFELTILNRWGNIVYQGNAVSKNFNGYNESGELLMEGVYFYNLRIESEKKHGFIQLVH
jgi:gliding motility-associated-like protein